MSISITIHVPKNCRYHKISSDEMKCDKVTILRQVIEIGLKEELTKLSIEKLKNKEVSIWKAAEIADLSFYENL